ncbi:MAG: ABC transporter ATP-binding protein [Candidatus Omnitrophica bacterium]|nr:ABC transporter ATP-binding protein [Candidatus Omnitrophota bacterium]MDD5553320.1 ABC transporter ATP-binding protein [Candidatus Omnitrophota bacterium]
MKNYSRLFKFAKPYYGELILSGIFMGIVTLLDVFRLSAIVPVVDRVFTNKPITFTQGKLPVFVENILTRLNSLEPLKVLYVLLIVMPVALVIRAIFEFMQSYSMSDVGQKVIRDVRNMVYDKLHSLSLDYFTQKRSGELVSRITNDVKLIENAVSYALTDLVYQSFQVISFALLTFLINWKMALISIVVLPMVMIPVIAVGKMLRKLSKRSQEKMADINSLLVENFTGVRIVRAFCAEARELERFKRQNHDYYKIAMKSIKRMLILGNVTELIGVAMALFIIYYSGRQVMEGALSFGAFALFMAALLSLIKPFKKLSQVSSIMQQAVAASSRIYEVLDTPPSIKEDPNALELADFKNDIVFEDVWFRYAEQDILKGVSMRVKKGSVLAVVGPSGTGKTTLVDLVPRFYDPRAGRIMIDGIDIKKLKLCSLRRLIGIVTQETILFNDTIKNNILYGKPEASEQQIEEAAKSAYAHDFIKYLPQGYDTIIGDRGTKLSGGERQRIAIARALLKNPPILILDEATSQLDTESERIVQEALNRLITGRTTLVIAHRLSTVKGAGLIVVLDKGRIVEQGSHQELLSKGGLYQKLYSMQEIEK